MPSCSYLPYLKWGSKQVNYFILVINYFYFMILIIDKLILICFEFDMTVNFGKIAYWIVTVKRYILEN